MSQTRRSLTLTAKDKADNLVIRETTVPPVGHDDVLINVKFCGLNFAEVSMRQVCTNSLDCSLHFSYNWHLSTVIDYKVDF